MMTARFGHVVIIGDSYTRFEGEADSPMICTGTIISFKYDHASGKTVAETKNSIYILGDRRPDYAMVMAAMGIPMNALCFSTQN